MFTDIVFGADRKRQELAQIGCPMNDQSTWYYEDPFRAMDEIKRMVDNSTAIYYFIGTQMCWEFWAETNMNNFYTLRMDVNHNHPVVMPEVFVISPVFDMSKEPHVWGNGSLCLVDPKDYRTDMTLLLFRNMASSWCLNRDFLLETGVWYAAEH